MHQANHAHLRGVLPQIAARIVFRRCCGASIFRLFVNALTRVDTVNCRIPHTDRPLHAVQQFFLR